MYKITMNTSTSYDIKIKANLLENLENEIKSVFDGSNIYVITDTNVFGFYQDFLKEKLASFNVHFSLINPGEESKSINTYQDLCEDLLDNGITRGDLLIAFGGGVVGDLTGFVASTLYRGLPYISIPTTLLSQVDSSIGGKTGIDFFGHKNILGSFNQPKLVLIDIDVLNTLPKRELLNGYGEMIKHAVIGSDKLWDLLENNFTITEEIICENLLVKKKFVEKDEFDKNERMTLNFGHTFGHLIELKNHLLHGEAVLSGMLAAVDLGVNLGLTNTSLKNRLLSLYKKYDLNYIEINYQDYLNDLHFDKKNISGVINFVIAKDICNIEIIPIMEDELCK